MPSKFPMIRLSPYRGINRKHHPYRLRAGELFEATNVFVNPDGSIERVKGRDDILSSDLGTAQTFSIYEWVRWDGSVDLLFFYNGSIKVLNNDGVTCRDILSGYNAEKRVRFANYSDYLYFGNGLDANKVIIPSYIHKFATTAVSTADATDLPSVKTLFNAIKAWLNTHIASLTYHQAADTTNVVTAADLVGGDSQDTTNTAVNELKADYNAHRSQAGVHTNSDDYHQVEAANATDLNSSIALVNQIKKCCNQHGGASMEKLWCITAPTTAPTLAPAAGSELEVGVYQYFYTYYNIVDGVESPPSPIGTVTTTGGNERVSVSDMVPSTDPQVTHIRLYRTYVAGGTFRRVTELTNITTSCTDSTGDNSLGTENITENFTDVPSASIFIAYEDRMYVAGDPENPQRVYFTDPLFPWRFNLATNYQDFDIAVKGFAGLPNGLMVFEENKTWFWPAPPKSSHPYVLDGLVRCCDPDSITLIDEMLYYEDASGGTGYLQSPAVWQSHYGVYASSGSNPVCISEKINSILLEKKIETATTFYDAFNGRLYVSVSD